MAASTSSVIRALRPAGATQRYADGPVTASLAPLPRPVQAWRPVAVPTGSTICADIVGPTEARGSDLNLRQASVIEGRSSAAPARERVSARLLAMALPAKADRTPAPESRRARDERILDRGYRDTLQELERLRKLGIVDEQGNLLKRVDRSSKKGRDFGGWG